MKLNGLEVTTSLYMTEPQEMRVSLPAGGGWTKHVMRTVQVPRRDALIIGNRCVIHPAMLPELRALADPGSASSEAPGSRTAMTEQPRKGF